MVKSDIHSADPYLDYDLISLSNTLQQSFPDGLAQAASILDAPFLVTDAYDQIIAAFPDSGAEEPDWNDCLSRHYYNRTYMQKDPRIFSAALAAENGSIHCFFAQSAPTKKQLRLMPYVGWMVIAAAQIDFPALSMNTLGWTYLKLLLDSRFDSASTPKCPITLPQEMQAAAVQLESGGEGIALLFHRLQALLNTEMITLYKERYMIALLPRLTEEQKNVLRDALRQQKLSVGLSYPYTDVMEFPDYLPQAISALKETRRMGRNDPLAEYAEYLPYDLFFCCLDDRPLSTFLHPALLTLAETDRQKNTSLLATLRAYVELGGSMSAVSEALHLHRNSVLYRLNTIRELTGCDMTDPQQRTALRCAFAVEDYLFANKK